MSYRINRLVAGLFLGSALAVSGAMAQSATTFGDKLGFMPRNDAVAPTIGGTGEVTAMLDGNSLTIDGEFEGMVGNVIDVAVHYGPIAGDVGEQFATLSAEGDNSGTFSGTIELDDEQLAALQNNSVYVIVRSDSNDRGELRAWLWAR